AQLSVSPSSLSGSPPTFPSPHSTTPPPTPRPPHSRLPPPRFAWAGSPSASPPPSSTPSRSSGAAASAKPSPPTPPPTPSSPPSSSLPTNGTCGSKQAAYRLALRRRYDPSLELALHHRTRPKARVPAHLCAAGKRGWGSIEVLH